MRKTKIICTLGPAVDSEEMLRQLMLKGMDVARLNFSHGSHEEHKARVERFKKVRDSLDLPVALLMDTKGPEIRLGKFKDKEVKLEKGDKFVLLSEDKLGDEKEASVSYKDLYKDVEKGSSILINDGLVELVVEKIKDKKIYCRVVNGGIIGDNKGINVPGVDLHLPPLTEKDIEDIKFAVENEFDFIAVSFVRKASDVIEIKKVLEENKGQEIKVIAKIENREAIENADEIVEVSDGIMIARGDLGVEIPVEEVPIVQKMLIEKCYKNGKPVITATQMLDSMIRNPRPTRAEASDIANAIYDGTSVIMLSGETAVGKYPVETLETMSKIAQKAEMSIDYWERFSKMQYDTSPSVTNALSHAACTTAQDLKASAIITVTQSGRTARMISRFRPQCPIIATTVSQRVRRQLSLSWGVYPYLVPEASCTDDMFDTGVEKALESKFVDNGDLVVITAGVPIGVSGTTNMLKVHVVGKVLVRGTGIGKKPVTGEVCVVKTIEEAKEMFVDGQVLVLPYTNDDVIEVIRKASALVVEEGGLASHTVTVGKALGIPVIIGTYNATKILKNGSVVTVDPNRGIVYYGSN
ncbi:pyruvate kinase [Acetivibrio saccincola]|jgi:pyruvate kinase|uniref:Pyruvate kinase n=1 Tax=Acetivibrio saccincola TaxID=1677857 RepID=A0A2K9E574_9FIRM|nr:pyruvate kinase [Acetivibrio saccincola]AUG56626.1 Pyruvate kinase [Acetivibrio saccincola]NLW27627.1 pyruvate kinase [Acetivibrio saccincola]PQQ66697.1 pyruvate kinase [Acetivibrio saccincola]